MSEFIAALPMYDWPEVRAETDAAWARLRDQLRGVGVDAPQRLARRNADLPPVPGGIRDEPGAVIAPDPAMLPPDEFDLATLWRHPALLFGQTCWGPMEEGLADYVTVVGQPDYSSFEGGEGELYSSAIVMRDGGSKSIDEGRTSFFTPPSGLSAISPARGEIRLVADLDAGMISPRAGEMADRPEGGGSQYVRSPKNFDVDLLRDARLAFNNPDSMSGLIGLTRDLEAAGESLAIFRESIETGSHRASIIAVAGGRADVCAVDCRTWQLAREFEPAANALAIVGWTAKRKGLPYIASRHLPEDLVARVREALSAI